MASSRLDSRQAIVGVLSAALAIGGCSGSAPSARPVGERRLALGGASLTISAPSTLRHDSDLPLTLHLSVPAGSALSEAVLTLSLDDLNGIGHPVDDGLVSDAVVDYGTGGGRTTFRPVTFVSATPGGPAGTAPATPAPGATTGAVTWALGAVPAGFTGQLSVVVHVPRGTTPRATIGAKATLVSGQGTTVAQTTTPTVVADEGRTGTFVGWDPLTPRMVPGAAGYLYGSVLNTAAQDLERIKIVTTSEGACTPTLTAVEPYSSEIADGAHPTRLVEAPPATRNVPMTTTSVVVDRLAPGNRAHSVLRFTVPASCAIGQAVTVRVVITDQDGANTLRDFRQTIPLEAVACPGAHSWYAHRVQEGLLVRGNYSPIPSWPEYYGAMSAVRPGEYFSKLDQYIQSSENSLTLDRFYFQFTVGPGVTFHGMRANNIYSAAYKDCDGSGLSPTNTAFNHTDPTLSGWSAMYNGAFVAPFTNPPSETDPQAAVTPGCRVLYVRAAFPPALHLEPQTLYRVCDGSYGCAAPALGSTALVHSAQERVALAGSTVTNCGSGASGTGVRVRLGSSPTLELVAPQAATPAGSAAVLELRPGNSNAATQYVKGRWGIDLYAVRELVDLDRVLGEVLTAGLQTPAPNENINGRSCDPATIAFVAPVAAGCQVPGDAGCFASWTIPEECQPSNNLGCATPMITTGTAFDRTCAFGCGCRSSAPSTPGRC
ncbi:MAG: hypothetical protein IPG96_21460 [Proteobacteria bacterium]|nr:hypothetical protein [Pseudomonadota bacterium]